MYKNNESSRRYFKWFIACFVTIAVSALIEVGVGLYFDYRYSDAGWTYRPLPTLFIAIGIFPLTIYFLVRYLQAKTATYCYVQVGTITGVNVVYGMVSYYVKVTVDGNDRTVKTNVAFEVSRLTTVSSKDHIGMYVKVGLDTKRNKWMVL